MKNKKPTPAQQEVINRMAAGWEFGRNAGFGERIAPREWLQLGGIGKGGATKKVRGGTAMSLIDKGLIEVSKSDWKSKTYKLTDAGRAAVKKDTTNE